MSIVLIDNTPGGVSTFPDAPGGSQIGPFKIGTNLYVLAQGDASFSTDTAVYKSTDNGATWTGPLDAAHSFTISGFQGWWSGFVIGTVLYFCFFNNNLGAQITLQKFDTTTDLYIAGAISHAVGFPSNASAVSTYNENTGRPSVPVVRSNGDIVIPMIEMENVAATFYYRTRFSVYNGAWVALDVLCGQNGQAIPDVACGTVLGSNDRTHVFYVEYGGKTLQHRTITSANAVQNAQTVAADIFDPGGVNTQSLIESIGSPAFNAATGEIVIPYKDVNGNLKLARATSADIPVWTTEKVQNSVVVLKHGQTTGSQVSAAYYDVSTGNLSVLFLDNQIAPSIVNLYRCTFSGGAWSAPELLFATGIPSGGGTIIQSIHAVSIASVFAIFFSPDNTGLNYILSGSSIAAPASGPTGVTVSIAPSQKPLRTVILPKICCKRKMCHPVLVGKILYVPGGN